MATTPYPQIYAQITSIISSQPILVQSGVALNAISVISIPQVADPVPYFVE